MHWPIFALMAIIQIAGVFAATHYYMRMRAVTVPAKYLWLFLTSLIGGAAGFTAHYLTIATVSPGDHLFLDPIFVTISGLIALSSIGLAFLFSFRFQPPASALSFALACHPMISAGNLATLLTAEVQGTLAYSTPHILLGLAVSFVVALVGSWCVERAQRFSRVILGTLALGCMTPFQVIVFLRGARITPDLAGPLPAGLTTDTTLVAVLSMATLVILLVGGAGLLIERRLENMAKVRYRQLAMTDPMTGLLNRIGLKDELSGHEFEAGHAHALFAIDLDRFKPINDLHGHEAGDVVLATLSRRLKETLSSRALTARTGGDEFIAIVDIGPGDASEAAARAIAATLLETFSDPVMFGEKSLTVSASIGIALQPRDAETLEDLQLAADIALYTAKKQRGTAIFYEAEMGEDVRKRTELATEMRRAIEQDEFVLHFQKQMHLGTRRISGFEALIRWQHPARGLLAPIEFIPIAEESDLISDIGRWVLNRACKVAATWPKPYPVAVNVAARQLAMPEFVEEVEDALLQSGLPANRLEIELTEASVIEDREQALDVMIRLRKLGVRLAMDDYGTGYASLAALQTFPFDKLKIDRSFIDGVSTNPQSKAIVRSTLLLTSALSVPVVAEGVETEEHIAFLTSEGCEDVQGFYFGQPMPERDVLSVIVAERARDAVDRACAEKA